MSGVDTLISVLMIGHSLFGQDGPDMLQGALAAGGHRAEVQRQIINGAPLSYNWEQASSAEGVDGRARLAEGGITHLILTEALPLANHVQWSESGQFARAFAELAEGSNPHVKVYLQETWHSLHSGTGTPVAHDAGADMPWRARISADLPVWEKIADEAGATLIPAGQAMGLLHDEIAAGRVPELGDVAALFSDDIHLNDLGHFFVGMVQYATLTGQDPLALPAQFSNRWGKKFKAPPPELAADLQRIAWEAVQRYQGARQAQAAAVSNPPAPAPAPGPAKSSPAVPTGPPPQPAAAPQRSAQAVGLAALTDWSTQQPFLDVMKTARPWIGHLPKRWGGMDHRDLAALGYLDALGWPRALPPELSSIGTLVLTDMPEEAQSLAGRYVLRFDGQGVIEVSGRARNIRYGKGELRFDYTPGPGSVEIRLQRIPPADPPRNITLVKQENLAAFDSGAIFNPNWLARLAPFSVLRMMDWMETNNAHLNRWQDRPQLGQPSYAGGIPLEVMLALGNHAQKDLWFNMPHLADDDFIRRFAETVRAGLDPGRKVYVEFSNEVWNWQFDQARWADEQAQARWGQKDVWMQYYGLRAAQIAQIWREVFDGADRARLVTVISSQTGWLGLEDQVLNAPLVQGEGLPAPARSFDAYAISGYFGGILGLEENAPLVRSWLDQSRAAAAAQAADEGLTGQAARARIAETEYDLAHALAGAALLDGAGLQSDADTLADLAGRIWPHHAQVARKHRLELIMYEGGSHVVGLGPQVEDAALTAFFQQFNYSPEMGRLYRHLLANWVAVGGTLFNAYSDVYRPTKWGSWGALRHLDDDNPRWDALAGH